MFAEVKLSSAACCVYCVDLFPHHINMLQISSTIFHRAACVAEANRRWRRTLYSSRRVHSGEEEKSPPRPRNFLSLSCDPTMMQGLIINLKTSAHKSAAPRRQSGNKSASIARRKSSIVFERRTPSRRLIAPRASCE